MIYHLTHLPANNVIIKMSAYARCWGFLPEPSELLLTTEEAFHVTDTIYQIYCQQLHTYHLISVTQPPLITL